MSTDGTPSPIPPLPHGSIECFGNFHGPEVLILVRHGGDCATFHVAESYLHHLGPRWTTTQRKRTMWRPKGLFGGRFSSIFGGSFGGVFRGPFDGLPAFCKNPRLLNLKGEYPDTIRILLQIVTLELIKVPKRLDFAEIVRLAEVAARWDCHAILATFIEDWVTPYREKMFQPGYEQWLYIAREFGYEDEYLQLARHLTTHCSVDSEDQLIALDGSVLKDRGKFPVDTLLHIHKGRRQILHCMIKALYDFWAKVANGSNCLVVDETSSYDYQSCAGVNLIQLNNHLRDKGLFPMIRTVGPIRFSAFELAKYMDTELSKNASCTFELDSEPSSTRRSTESHINCQVGLTLGPIMQDIVDNARWPVDISIVEYIRSNAKKMGKEPSKRDIRPELILSSEGLSSRREMKAIESALNTCPDILSLR